MEPSCRGGSYDRLMPLPRTSTNETFKMRIAAAASFAFICCACSGQPPPAPLVPYGESVEGTSRVSLLVATTRDRLPANVGQMFDTPYWRGC